MTSKEKTRTRRVSKTQSNYINFLGFGYITKREAIKDVLLAAILLPLSYVIFCMLAVI